MPFPNSSDYDDAIQNPITAFTDVELRTGINDGPQICGVLGPVASGNFAVVYRFRCGSKRYAVKCFTRQPPKDQAQRFLSIHQHLLTSRLNCATGFQFLPQGILVRGFLYPLLKMEWLDAPTLLAFIPKNLQDREGFRQLSESFLSVCEELRKNQIAHGDLQHGNLLVFGGRVRIIDYDGMCVPGTAGLPSVEDGLPHYQHPLRQGGVLSSHFDHFPSLVIWTSLHALSIDPSLWGRHVKEHERLLFSKDDFLNPQGSAIFRELLSYGDERLSKAVMTLQKACAVRELAEVPPLTEVIISGSVVVDPEWWRSQTPAKANKISSEASLTEHQPGRPDWMPAEQTPPLPLLPARFGHSIIRDRIFVYSYVALVIAAAFGNFAGTVSSDALIFGVIMLGGLLGFNLITSYMVTPAVTQKRFCTTKLQQAYSKVAGCEVRLKHWKVEQESVVEQQMHPVKKHEEKLARLQAQCRQRQNEFDTRLQGILQTLSRERQQMDARERQALQDASNQMQQLETKHLERLRRIEAESTKANADATLQIDDLRREKEKKKEVLLATLLDEAVRVELMRSPIRVTSIESLTEGNVKDLEAQCIRYAADFVDCQSTTKYGAGSLGYLIVKADGMRVKIPGIGEKRANDLIAWRDGLERRALGRVRVALSPLVVSEIERETEQRRQNLVARANAAKAEAARLWTEAQVEYGKQKTELTNKILNARQVAASNRETLANCEQQERHDIESQKTAALAPINREIWQLQSIINPAKHKVDVLRGDYQKLLIELNKEHGEMRFAVASIEREREQFRNIRVSRYLARVFAFAGE